MKIFWGVGFFRFTDSSLIRQRRRWHPTPVLLPGKPHGWRSLVGYSPWGREESDTVRYSSGQGRKRKDDLNRSRLPLFRQGGTTVSLMTRLSVERDQEGSIFVGRLVEAIRETLIRRDVLGIF